MKRSAALLPVSICALFLAGCSGEAAKVPEAAAAPVTPAEAPAQKDPLLSAVGIGVTDLEKYSVKPGTKNFIPDFFVD